MFRNGLLGWGLALALAIAAGIGCAYAQLPLRVPGTMTWPGLSGDDIDRMSAAAARLYEGRSIGTVERWRNPDTGNAGSVTLTRSFEQGGMPCRELAYEARIKGNAGNPERYTLNWCKTPEGRWGMAQ